MTEMQEDFNVSSSVQNGNLKIFINSILFLALIEFHNVIGIYNYYENGSQHIEIFYKNKESPIKVSFDKEAKWIKVIDEICKYI